MQAVTERDQQKRTVWRYAGPFVGALLIVGFLLGPGLSWMSEPPTGVAGERMPDVVALTERLAFAPGLGVIHAFRDGDDEDGGQFGRDPAVIDRAARSDDISPPVTIALPQAKPDAVPTEDTASATQPDYLAEPGGGDLDEYHWGMIRGLSRAAPQSRDRRAPAWQAGRFASPRVIEAPKAGTSADAAPAEPPQQNSVANAQKDVSNTIATGSLPKATPATPGRSERERTTAVIVPELPAAAPDSPPPPKTAARDPAPPASNYAPARSSRPDRSQRRALGRTGRRAPPRRTPKRAEAGTREKPSADPFWGKPRWVRDALRLDR
ncbi:MAG: hypothetical protein AAFQ45_03790 [Pseudomonadota bacterium]